MITDAQVEAAARALCASLGENPDWQHYYRDARAALEAAAQAAAAEALATVEAIPLRHLAAARDAKP